MTEKVTAELVARETGPLTRELLIAFTDKATGQPITHFDEELTQELHVLATDSDFSSFVHEHADKPEKFVALRQSRLLPLPIFTDCDRYLNARRQLMEMKLATANRLAAANKLPDAIITAHCFA